MKRSGFKRKHTKPLKRKNRAPRQILRDKAWRTFSKWIRNRDPNCVTCGGKAENAGHFYHGVLDFDPMNINSQCVRCNKWLYGNLAIYSNYLLSKYGKKKFEELNARHYKALKGEYRTEQEYIDLIEKYRLE